LDIGKISTAVCTFGRRNAQENYISILHSTCYIGCKSKSPSSHTFGNKFLKSRLYYWQDPLVEVVDLQLHYVNTCDDMTQVRPGRLAAAEFSIIGPLRDAGLTKAEIRELSRALDLPTADAPAGGRQGPPRRRRGAGAPGTVGARARPRSWPDGSGAEVSGGSFRRWKVPAEVSGGIFRRDFPAGDSAVDDCASTGRT
jgi:hypothetical protein